MYIYIYILLLKACEGMEKKIEATVGSQGLGEFSL